MWIGSPYPKTPYVEIGKIATAFYFSFYLIIVPIIGLVENTLMDTATEYN
jgi:ubiquinol-cytochrome c reductase cytochrome b subunit